MGMKDTSISAFPRPVSQDTNGNMAWDQMGMSLRDWFAGMALSGMVSNRAGVTGLEPRIAMIAYSLADAMLKERESS